MPTIVTLNNQSVAVTSINVQVTCPSCTRSYNVRMKGAAMRRNCNCNKCTLFFTITPMRGRVSVRINYQLEGGQTGEIDADSVEVEE